MNELHSDHFSESFSQREREILFLIKQGLSNQAIAERLSLALGTVKWYNRQAFAKLDVNNRIQAIEKAEEIGLIGATNRKLPGWESFPQPAPRLKHNLPVSLTSFIGRKKENADLRTLLHSSTSRLVTILGVGGVGKTRLALRIAEEALSVFPHGVWLVDMAPAVDSRLVPQFVANALGIHESGDLTYEEVLVRYLSPRSILLVIDNCEHLVNACARLVSYLLTHCQHLRILATSREVLGVAGEVRYILPPLCFPDPHHIPELKHLRLYDAVQLFVERAGLGCPGFTLTMENGAAIAQICQRVDGIPLALELAAARTILFSVEQIAARLEHCFSMLSSAGRTAITRHQTMRTVLDWSYNLLNEPEQVLLCRLAVFAGSWTFEAAEQICCHENREAAIDLLDQLVNKSLVIAFTIHTWTQEFEPASEVRYRLLEPIRQYALEKLDQTGEVEALRDRHLAYFINLAEKTSLRPFQNRWPNQWKLLKSDQDNLRAALGWALADEHSDRVEDGLKLVGALSDYWTQFGQNREGSAWVDKALALSENRGPSYQTLRALFFQASGHLAGLNTDYTEAKRLLSESVALFRASGDEWRLARVLATLALWSYPVDQDGARRALDESIAIARRVNDPIILALSLFCQGDMNSKLGNTAASIQAGKESLMLLLDIGERGDACYPIALLAQCAIQQGDVATALQYRQEYLKYRSKNEDFSMDYYASGFLLHTAYHLGDIKEVEAIAQTLLGESVGHNIGARDYALRNLGIVHKCQGDYRTAAACYYESICGAKKMNDSFGILACISGLAGIVSHLEQPYRAARLFGAVEKLLKAIQRTLAWGPERGEYEKEVAGLHKTLSAEDFSQAYSEGRSMTFEEAVQEAYLIVEELSSR